MEECDDLPARGRLMRGEIVQGPITLFYSYSHKDESLREQLANHLMTLQRAGFIREWHDRQILGGEEWDKQISIHLERAQVILLLISADFLASKYCYDIEAKRALERHSTGAARVIPIILRPVLWKLTPFATLQALPTDARAVTEWPNRDVAFVNICEGILAIVVAWKHNLSRLGAQGGTITGPPEFRHAVNVRKRVMDAALPRRVQVGAATALVIMLRREDSSGLRAIVELETSYGLRKEDVRSTGSFPIEFPVDSSGVLAPLELELEIHAPDFSPPVQGKRINVPPGGDSDPKIFLLTPQRLGELLLTVQLGQRDREIASCLLRTEAEITEQEITAGGHSLVSIPLDVLEVAERDAAPSVPKPARHKPPRSEKGQALRRCENGHFYDPQKHTTCPYCGVPAIDVPTTPKGAKPEPRPSEDLVGRTRVAGLPSVPEARPGVGDDAMTRPLIPAMGKIDLVVGWLVCVHGPEKGRDYRIRSEINTIGRSKDMYICIAGDDSISRERHAVITFDPQTNCFYLSPGEGRGLVYHNGKALFATQQLQSYDQIMLGKTKLVFVALCGDRFKWEYDAV
jgi:hypothetical protein